MFYSFPISRLNAAHAVAETAQRYQIEIYNKPVDRAIERVVAYSKDLMCRSLTSELIRDILLDELEIQKKSIR